MKPIIQIKKISKKYRIMEQKGYYSFRDILTDIVKNPLSVLKKNRSEEFWALKNISFDVYPGEVIGIIGKNGSGKSTLLKILSQITPPTKGKTILRGRVASLLEIGTGFHPELTGRENIYLNGTLLGMTKKEINLRFDEIVTFAEIDQFLDTPVKHYSSGMYMRLAFSVAAHLEPEILIVDEVLSVGDAAFQKKSLGKMQDVSEKGRTVLFVSHNMHAITSLCQKVYLLDEGKIVKSGPAQKVVSEYLNAGIGLTPEVNCQNLNFRNDAVQMTRVRIINKDGQVNKSFDIRKPLGVEIFYKVIKSKIYFSCNIQLTNETGIVIFNSPEDVKHIRSNAPQKSGIYKSTCWIPGNFLAEGVFVIRASLDGFIEKRYPAVHFNEAITFRVIDTIEGDSVRGSSTGFFPGIVRPKLDWSKEFIGT